MKASREEEGGGANEVVISTRDFPTRAFNRIRKRFMSAQTKPKTGLAPSSTCGEKVRARPRGGVPNLGGTASTGLACQATTDRVSEGVRYFALISQ